MDTAVQQQLLDLNRDFYARFARAFADSRTTYQASLRRVTAAIADASTVLDIGCGDGRVARVLAEQGRRVRYAGVDASAPLIALAQERCRPLAQVSADFIVADVTAPGWQDALPAAGFDHVLALAVLHHIPGAALRAAVVGQLAALLAPRGRLVLSTWQFMSSERLRRRVLPWSTIGLDEGRLEPGDYLLDWQRGGYGLRYCCLLGEDELRALLAGAGLVVSGICLADNGLNLYAVAHVQPALS